MNCANCADNEKCHFQKSSVSEKAKEIQITLERETFPHKSQYCSLRSQSGHNFPTVVGQSRQYVVSKFRDWNGFRVPPNFSLPWLRSYECSFPQQSACGLRHPLRNRTFPCNLQRRVENFWISLSQNAGKGQSPSLCRSNQSGGLSKFTAGYLR